MQADAHAVQHVVPPANRAGQQRVRPPSVPQVGVDPVGVGELGHRPLPHPGEVAHQLGAGGHPPGDGTRHTLHFQQVSRVFARSAVIYLHLLHYHRVEVVSPHRLQPGLDHRPPARRAPPDTRARRVPTDQQHTVFEQPTAQAMQAGVNA